MAPIGWLAGGLGALAWMLLAARPEDRTAWAVAAAQGWRVLLAGAILSACWGAGLPLADLFAGRSRRAGRLARLGSLAMLLPLALGMAAASMGALALGALGFATRQGLTLLFLGLAFAGLASVRRRREDGVPLFAPRRGGSGLPGGWTLALGVWIGAFGLAALAPPTSYDVLEYHLAGPLAWIQAGTLAPLRGNFYTALPSALEALFAMAAALGGRIDGIAAAKLLHFGALLGWLGVSARLFRSLGVRDSRLQAAGVLLLLAFPATFLSASDANNDLAAALFYGLAFVALIEGWGAARAGLLLGLGMGFKFTLLTVGLGPLGVALIFLGAFSKAPGRGKRTALGLVKFGLGVGIGFLPWAIRAWLATGYPLFPSTGLAVPSPAGPGALEWSPALAAEYLGVHLAKMPWEASWWSQWAARLGQWGWGWALALAAGLALGAEGVPSGNKRSLRAGAAGLAALGGTAAWSLLGTSPPRFLLPILPLAAGCLLASAERLAKLLASADKPRARSLAGGAAAGLALLAAPQFLAVLLALDEYDMPKALVRPGDPWAHQAQFLQGWDQAPFAETLAEESELAEEAGLPPVKVLLLYEARSAHLAAESATVTVHDAFPSEWGSLAKLRAAGFTHLLVNELELERLRAFYPVRPEHRARRVGEAGRLPAPGSPRATPGTAAFYADWLPWSGPASPGPPALAQELPEARERAVLSAKGLTGADHRVWLLDLRK